MSSFAVRSSLVIPLSCAALALLPACGGAEEAPPAASVRAATAIATGKVQGWPEATAHLLVDFGPTGVSVAIGEPREAGLDAFWSIASTRPGAGFFYADAIRGTAETRVAYAEGVARVEDIRDAAAFTYERDAVGPVPLGGIVLVEHLPSRRYLALVLDAVHPADPRTAGAGPYAWADVTWYLTPDGGRDFAAR